MTTSNDDRYALFNSTLVGGYTRLPWGDELVRLIHKNEGVGYTQDDLDNMEDDPEGVRVLKYVYEDSHGVYHTLTYVGDIVYYDFPYENYTADSYWGALDHDTLTDDEVFMEVLWCDDSEVAEPLDINKVTSELVTTEPYADYYATSLYELVREAVCNTITDLHITERYSPALLERIHNHIKEEYL